MRGKLYTTYFSKMKKAVGIKISITRFPPRWLDLDKENMINMKELSPSSNILMGYKNGEIDWEMYTSLFIIEMQTRDDMKWGLNKVKSLLDEGKNVSIVCFEKDRNVCHRSLICDYFDGLGYEVNEIE